MTTLTASEARANLYRWSDALREGRDATNIGYVAGVGYRFRPRQETIVELEHNARNNRVRAS